MFPAMMHMSGRATAAAGGLSGFYVALYRTTDQLGASTNELNWNAEISDNQNVHDNSTNSNRITIPSAWNNRYGHFQFNHYSSGQSAGGSYLQTKNGTQNNHFGSIRASAPSSSGDDGDCSVGPPIQVTSGDWYSYQFNFSTTIRESRSCSAFTLFPSTFEGCAVKLSGDFSLSAATTTVVTWDTEEYDLNSYHSTSSNTERMTVPSGVSLVRLYGGIDFSVTSGQCLIELNKNTSGTLVDGGFKKDLGPMTRTQISAMSAPLAVSAGDWFQLRAFSDGGGSAKAGNGSWFAIQKLDSSLKYALVNRSSTASMANGDNTISWNNEVVDTDGWHDNATNPSRLTVPSGVSRVRVGYNTEMGGAGDYVTQIYKNGSVLTGAGGQARQDAQSAGNDFNHGWTPPLDVTAGDYFELVLNNSTTSQTLAIASSWFCIEEVPTVST